MTDTFEETLLPGNAEEFEAAIEAAIDEALDIYDAALDEADAEDLAKRRNEDPAGLFAELIAKRMVDTGETRQQATLAVAREDSALAVAARDAEPVEKYGLRPAEHFQKSVPVIEAEQSPDAPHEVSDRYRRQQAEHDAAKAEFARRVNALVRETGATSRPLTHEQATLAVARQDPALYGAAKSLPVH